jgi:PAS domain S-box-containing protein
MIHTIADTLLHVGERVMCVSKEMVIIDVWDAPGCSNDDNSSKLKGVNITELTADALPGPTIELIKRSIADGKDEQAEYAAIKHGTLNNYSVRVLHIAVVDTAVFIVFERLHTVAITSLEQERWMAALDAVGDGMWDMNLETGHAYFSDKWHSKFDDEIVAVHTIDEWRGIIHPDDYKRSVDKLAQYLSGKESDYTCELRYKCRNGKYKWLLSRGVVIAKDENGNPLRAIGTHTDIDERKRKEQEHQSTLQLLSTLIEKMQDALMVIDGEDKILFANQAYCDMYNVTVPPLELKGMPIEESLASRRLLVKNPESFSERVMEIHSAGAMVLDDTIELLNGKIYSRDYIPITLGNDDRAEIWKFRDITDQKLAQRRYEQQRLFYEKILNNIPEDISLIKITNQILSDKHIYDNYK